MRAAGLCRKQSGPEGRFDLSRGRSKGADSFVRFNLLEVEQKRNGCEWGPAIFHPQPLPRAETRFHFKSKLEPKNDSSDVPEIALVIVAAAKTVSEPGENEIKVRRPDGNGFAQWDVDSSTNDEIPCIVTRSRGACAGARIHADIVLQI